MKTNCKVGVIKDKEGNVLSLNGNIMGALVNLQIVQAQAKAKKLGSELTRTAIEKQKPSWLSPMRKFNRKS